jgi:hypothetical protein
MKSKASQKFWKNFRQLPAPVQRLDAKQDKLRAQHRERCHTKTERQRPGPAATGPYQKISPDKSTAFWCLV